MPQSPHSYRWLQPVFSSLAACTLALGLTQCSSQAAKTPAPAESDYTDTVNVTMHHYDNSRSGVQPNETVLTPANLNQSTFGKLFSAAVDGSVYAQPLIATNITMSDGKPHSLLLVATENDSMFAFDADSGGSAFWKSSLLQSGETAVPNANVGVTDISPLIGITGTPVMDSTKGIIYVVAKSVDGSGNYYQRLHALNVQNGQEMPNSPVTIAASVPGGGAATDAVNGQIAFNPKMQLQRTALGLSNGVVWIAWASHGDIQPYHGWLMGYDATKLTQTYVFNDTPYGYQGGIWLGAGGPAFDSAGNVFLASGNGHYQPPSDYGSSALKLTPGSSGQLTVADYFTPCNWGLLEVDDVDLGVSATVLLPDQSGPVPHLMVTSDKGSLIYLINRDNMGKFNASTNNVVQTFSASNNMQYQNLLFFNNTLFVGTTSAPLSAFTFDPTSGQFQTKPSSATTCTNCFVNGTAPTISANGTTNAVLWALDNSSPQQTGNSPAPAILRAYNPTNLSQELYDSNQAGGRDQPANAIKFTTAVVANGHVYVGGDGAVTVYGLLSQ